MNRFGTLYVVATPIGNLDDISHRAIKTLTVADLVAAEDTRHCLRLFERYGIQARLVSLHDYSAAARISALIERLEAGENIALVADAGTPLIADPGYELVCRARDKAINVVPVPGPSALIAALSVAGLPTNRFVFEGFLPVKSAARRTRLSSLAVEARTMVFYEAPHRILDTLGDCIDTFGRERRAVICRELTKHFETVLAGTLADLRQILVADADQRRGEMVLLLAGAPKPEQDELLSEGIRVYNILRARLSQRDAVVLASEITRCPRNLLYQASLDLR